jgi:hypothetical protein
LDLVEADCDAVGGTWVGEMTQCGDGSICNSGCEEDFDGDGPVGVNDLLFVVGEWGLTDSEADLDGSGSVDTPDLLAVIAAWGVCE